MSPAALLGRRRRGDRAQRAALARGTVALVLLAVVAVALNLPHPTADTAGMGPGQAVSQATADAAGAGAMALVDAPLPAGWRLRFRPAAPGAPRAQTDRGTRTITVFVRAGDPRHRIAHDTAHELGHAWDHDRLTAAGRRAYLDVRRAGAAPWWPRGAWSDYATGAGDFAEVYARCHAAGPEFRSRLAPPPADACAALPAGARR